MSTVQVAVAGVGSTLPAASVALTEKVCAPSVRPVSPSGELQDANDPLSSLHANVAAPSAEVKATDWVDDELVAGIAVAIVVSGAVVSTVKARLAAALALGRASTATT